MKLGSLVSDHHTSAHIKKHESENSGISKENLKKGFKRTGDSNKINFNVGSINVKTLKTSCFKQPNNLSPNNSNEDLATALLRQIA